MERDKKEMTDMNVEDNIVKAVFYAVVVSVLASAYFAVQGEPILVGCVHTWAWLPEFITRNHSQLNCVWRLADFWMVPLSYFLFFTGYFYDEWRQSSTYNGGVQNCCEIFDVLAWCCFVVQVALIKAPVVSAKVGVIGCIFTTISLCFNKNMPWKFAFKMGWVIQNILWISAIALFLVAGKWCYVVLMIIASLIFLMKVVIWFFVPAKRK